MSTLSGGDTYHGDSEVVELGEAVAEVAGFLGAAWGVGAWVEVDQYTLTGVVAQAGGGACIVG